MAAWTPCPDSCQHTFDNERLSARWTRLHARDTEAWPSEPALQEGWRLYHQGHFEAAASAGLEVGGSAGTALANRAASMHASYVEIHDSVRFARLQEVAERARRQQLACPDDATAWYWQGYALGRYSQGVSVAKALARGLGRAVRVSLETCLRLSPHHVDAHLALARFHAETIDQVGELIGGMVHGARKDQGLMLYEQALSLAPDSLIVLHEAADGLLMLLGDSAQERVKGLLQRAAGIEPQDAMETLYLRAAEAVTSA